MFIKNFFDFSHHIGNSSLSFSSPKSELMKLLTEGGKASGKGTMKKHL